MQVSKHLPETGSSGALHLSISCEADLWKAVFVAPFDFPAPYCSYFFCAIMNAIKCFQVCPGPSKPLTLPGLTGLTARSTWAESTGEQDEQPAHGTFLGQTNPLVSPL